MQSDFVYVQDTGAPLDAKKALSKFMNAEQGILQIDDDLAKIKLNLSFIANECEFC